MVRTNAEPLTAIIKPEKNVDEKLTFDEFKAILLN